jgi:NADH:ubiquinone oxidoreductase subunit 5 (subunit L)/multisubunit Na+/H+ antiporter MnhA subunit
MHYATCIMYAFPLSDTVFIHHYFISFALIHLTRKVFTFLEREIYEKRTLFKSIQHHHQQLILTSLLIVLILLSVVFGFVCFIPSSLFTRIKPAFLFKYLGHFKDTDSYFRKRPSQQLSFFNTN